MDRSGCHRVAARELSRAVCALWSADPAIVRSPLVEAGAVSIFLLLGMAIIASSSARAQDCIDYGDYLHSVGSVRLPSGAFGVAVSGNHAYVADGYSGLQVVDISNPASPAIVGSVDTPDNAFGVAVGGDYACVADWNSGLQVVDISNPASPAIVGSVDMPGRAYDVAVGGNYAYIADSNSRLQVVDISDPASPVIVGSVTPGSAQGVAVRGNYAYVADGYSGLQVVDISNPASPTIVGGVDTPGGATGVAVAGNHAYVADYWSGLQVIDISDPASPAIVGSVDTPGGAIDVAVGGNYAYVPDWNSGLQVVDISNPASPAIVGNLDPPRGVQGVAVAGNYAYVAAALEAVLQVVDISNPTDPPLVGSVDTPGSAVGVAVAENYAYIADGSSGLQVVDISNPAVPAIVGSVVTPGSAAGVVVTGDVACVDNGQDQIWVIDVADPNAPAVVGNIASYCGVGAAAGDYVYATGSVCVYGWPAPPPPWHRLEAIDVSDPVMPAVAGVCGTPAWTGSVALTGHYALVTTYFIGGGIPECLGGVNSLQVVDVTYPAFPTIVGSVNIMGNVNSWNPGLVVANGHHAYVALSSSFQVFDITDPTAPTLAGDVELQVESISGLAASGNHAYVTARGSRIPYELRELLVIDITNPAAPTIVAKNARCSGNGVVVKGNLVYLTDEESGLRIYPAQCPAATPVALSSFEATMMPEGILLTWSTSFESDHLGFRVHRAARPDGDYARLTELIEPPGPHRFLDTDVRPGATYFYRLEAVDRSGGSEFYGPLEALAAVVPAALPRFALLQNQPNPFVAERGATAIGFALGERAHAQLGVYDATGRLVRVLVDEVLAAGEHRAMWDGRSDRGRDTASGIYYYRLDAGPFSEVLTLAKVR